MDMPYIYKMKAGVNGESSCHWFEGTSSGPLGGLSPGRGDRNRVGWGAGRGYLRPKLRPAPWAEADRVPAGVQQIRQGRSAAAEHHHHRVRGSGSRFLGRQVQRNEIRDRQLQKTKYPRGGISAILSKSRVYTGCPAVRTYKFGLNGAHIDDILFAETNRLTGI